MAVAKKDKAVKADKVEKVDKKKKEEKVEKTEKKKKEVKEVEKKEKKEKKSDKPEKEEKPKKEKSSKKSKAADEDEVKVESKERKRKATEEKDTEVPDAKRTRGESDESGEDTSAPPNPEDAFSKFRLSKDTIKRLLERGVTHLFPIQEASFDPIFDGKDVLGRARTGTGKTLSFALPIVERLRQTPRSDYGRAPRALVLAPTRELAKQVCGDFVSIGHGLSATCIYGGTPYSAQESELRRGVDVVVGTPGRIIDHIDRNNLKLQDVAFLVLDEADQMLDIGFKDAIEAVLKAVKGPHQTMLYSATVPAWVQDTAKKHMREDKVTIDLVKDEKIKTSTLIDHLAVRCHWQDRATTLRDILTMYSGSNGRTIVFTETKREANELSVSSDLKGAQPLHGDIAQAQRETTLQGFREGAFGILIATDVAARGLDIPEVDVVVQCEPPSDVDTYVHRSGRTGRAGKAGVCIVFYKPNQEYMLSAIERRTGCKFTKINPPQPEDIMRAVARDAKTTLEKIPDQVLPYFQTIAEEMIASRGAVPALAAALAHISGYTQIEKRSLLSSTRGFTTFHMIINTEMRGTGYAWNILERNLTPELKESVRGMRMCLDRKGCVFDIPNDKVELVEELWKDGYSATLSQATELPPMVELPPRENSWGGGQRGGWGSPNRGGGGRGGFRGGASSGGYNRGGFRSGTPSRGGGRGRGGRGR